MANTIIKQIKIENGIPMFLGACRNESPRRWSWYNIPEFTEIYQAHGQEDLDFEILCAYENNAFIPGTHNKYSRCISRLRRMPEYAKFNWKLDGDDVELNRHTLAFNEILWKAWNTKDKKTKCKLLYNSPKFGNLYVRKFVSGRIFYTDDINKAKQFNFVEDADEKFDVFQDPENYTIIYN